MTLMDKTLQLTQSVFNNETGKKQKSQAKQISSSGIPDQIITMPALRAVVNNTIKYPVREKLDRYLEDDEVCRVNVILVLLEACIVESAAMTKKCVGIV